MGKDSPVVIARGGRYDKLVKQCGAVKEEAAGLGFSFAIERIKEITANKTDNAKIKDTVLIAYSDFKNLEEALLLQRQLHEKGHRAIVELHITKNLAEAEKLLFARKCNRLEWLDS